MFEDVPISELAATLAEHDFSMPEGATYEQLMGSDEVDALVAFDRLERFIAAGRAGTIARLDRKRRDTLNPEQATLDGTWVDEATIAQSVVTEVALCRQMSNSGAESLYAFAIGLADHRHTAARLAEGRISERVAKAVVGETWPLPPDGRAWVDAQMAGDLPWLTAKRAAEVARRLVQTYDPHAAHVRATQARADRHVTADAKPDAMSSLGVYAPAEQIAAAYAALDDVARGLKADGDPRTISQLMADAAIERLTGQSKADDVAVEIQLLMRSDTLLGDDDTPALLAGYGPLPPETARRLTGKSRVWLRRLFTDPHEDKIVGRDSRRRRFDGPLGALIRAADQHCQRPWCDCKIRDIDHKTPYAAGGLTVRDESQGLCRRSHTTRHLPGWKVIGQTWTTPTGHSYQSRRPRPLGHGPAVTRPRGSVAERHLRILIGKHGHLRQ